jgi:hypothetical protein
MMPSRAVDGSLIPRELVAKTRNDHGSVLVMNGIPRGFVLISSIVATGMDRLDEYCSHSPSPSLYCSWYGIALGA